MLRMAMTNLSVCSGTFIDSNTLFSSFITYSPTLALYIIIFFFICLLAILTCVIVLKTRGTRKINNLLYLDTLTGYANDAKFRKEAVTALSDRHVGGNLALWYMDIAQFKNVNDAFGYSLGDNVLILVSNIIAENVNDHELFCRVNADIFQILFRYNDVNSLFTRIRNIIQLIEGIPSELDVNCRLTLRSGLYFIEKPLETTIEYAINSAIYAMKSVPLSHNHEIIVYNHEIHKAIHLERDIEACMDKALIEGEFISYFQPKFDIHKNVMVGAEALVRWISPTKGIMSPGDFVPIFEKNGFIRKIDYRIFTEVCKRLVGWINQGFTPVPVSCNFSRLHLLNNNFPDELLEIANSYQVPTNLLEIEITETVAMDNTELFLSHINRLREYGFHISLDDFGSGYSSMGLLADLPIDVLKLDRTFVHKDIISDKERIVMESIVSTARKLNISVVCEGVETTEQNDFVRSVGVSVVQGFLYERPITDDKFASYLSQINAS